IMVMQEEDRAVIFDLNLARVPDLEAAVQTQTGVIMGTPAYMSPEQTRGERTLRTDVYGLGAGMWELLTGRRVFLGPDLADIIRQVREQEAEQIRKFNPAVTTDLEAIVLKCLEKDPARRYQSMRELADDLQRWLDGEPVLARPPSKVRRLYRYFRHRPWVIVTILSF